MEVHQPKQTPRSWGEFLKEVGIIVLGVLIALSAEQSVQWLHRYTNRRQLEADLREEMRMNDRYLRDDIKVVYDNYGWAMREAQAIQTAVLTNNPAPYEKAPSGPFVIPRHSVWAHARESGTVALLPRDEAEAYTALYDNRDVLSERLTKYFGTFSQQDAFEMRFAHGREPLTNLSQVPPAQLEQLSGILADLASAARSVLVSLGRMASMQNVIESGSFSQGELINSYSDSRNPARKLMQAEAATSPEHNQTH
jgi:hypothetical protein